MKLNCMGVYTFPSFCGMKGKDVLLLNPPGWDANPFQITTSISLGFPDNLPKPIYTPG